MPLAETLRVADEEEPHPPGMHFVSFWTPLFRSSPSHRSLSDMHPRRVNPTELTELAPGGAGIPYPPAGSAKAISRGPPPTVSAMYCRPPSW